ncbi:MAG: serine/threonine protein kinase [Candidatus Azobacteroides sp.]|nr:serine/threonine protein kinase [Candidatus Azobacteroides sp.]
MYLKQGYCLHNDKYRLLNVLGEGGFSLTYRGAWKTEVQGNLGKVPAFVPVCIKEYFFKDHCIRNSQTGFVEPNSETGKEIFEKNKEKIIKEARILSEIHHPNVVNVLEVFKQNNTVYIVMEFISGHSLKYEVEQNGVFSEEKLKKIIYPVGQALDYIHEKNILHLDIKPGNILIDQNNNPKLIDFGISKKYDLLNDQETSTALLAASKGYASIEQYDSEGIQVFSPRPDIYSLGATMYYLITGQVPTESILRSTKGLQNPRELNPAISENTEHVILKAMALNASDRYQSVMELLLDLGFDPATDKIDLTSVTSPEYPESGSSVSDEPYDFDTEDETQIRSAEVGNKRQKEYTWMYIVIPLLVSGLLAFIIYGNFGKKLPDEPVTDLTSAINPTDSVNIQVSPGKVDSAISIQPDLSVNPIDNPTSKPEETKQETYQKLFNEAVIVYNQKNLKQARELFLRAQSYVKNTDTERYITQIDEETEKEEIQKRKDLYEEQMKFGNFVVVKKKTNERWGAIDDKGYEKIPCIYTSTEPSNNNRLFQREDNLYDKYAPNGDLLAQGTNGLE